MITQPWQSRRLALSGIRGGWCLLVASLFVPANLPAAPASQPAGEAEKFQPNPKLTAIAENTWAKVAEFNMPTGVLAYSGGVYDSAHHQVLNFGGGHADYSGNEVIAFSPATLTWTKMYEPDAGSRYMNKDNADIPNGKLKDSDRPFTRHSYNRLCFVTSTASMFVSGGCGPGMSGMAAPFYCNRLADAWSYSYADNKWSMLNSKDVPAGGYCDISYCYDTKRDAVWGYVSQKLHRFDPKAKTWSATPVKGKGGAKFDNGGYGHCEYLAKSDCVLAIVGPKSFTINLDTFEAEPVEAEKIGPAGGLTYLPGQDAALYVAITKDDECSCAVFDCASRKWHELQPANLPAGAKKSGTSGEVVTWSNLHYDPVDKVALLVTARGVWAYMPPGRFKF